MSNPAAKPKNIAPQKKRRRRRLAGKTTFKAKPRVPDTARLEARIPNEIYEIMKRAAELKGISLTSYIIDSLGEKARKDVEAIEIIRLTRPEQLRFAEALLNPPAPNARLKSAFALREDLIARR